MGNMIKHDISWDYPPITLLHNTSDRNAERGDIQQSATIIERVLKKFGVLARVVEVNLAPQVTQFLLKLDSGKIILDSKKSTSPRKHGISSNAKKNQTGDATIDISNVTSLLDTIAHALDIPKGLVRIESPVPGRDMVGLEIPNHKSEIISLNTMLTSDQMQNNTDVLTVPLGRSTGSGQLMALSIALMPHVLIAGSTGSGKSTLLHTWICSILMRAKPEQVRLVLIDPKRVELLGYNGVPHLVTPVILQSDHGVSALQWAHDEMNRRYELLTQIGVRNIDAYNELSGFQALPYILIFIDEFSDLMAYAPEKAEDLVSRLAQMAQATGIHMIISTSRSGIDVYTDLLCGSIPTKIVFNTASIDDSMRIIGIGGAEKLLGQGDMIYVPPLEKPIRIQGAYIAEKDIENLTSVLKKQVPRSQISLSSDTLG